MLNYKIASNCNDIMNINFIFLIPDLSFCLLSRHFTNCLDNRQIFAYYLDILQTTYLVQENIAFSL